VGENNHLAGPFSEAPNLLHSRESPVFVQTRYWVVNYDDLVCQPWILVERSEEKGQDQGIAISRAKRIAKGRLPRCGISPSDEHR
jgi:hypothetical protein